MRGEPFGREVPGVGDRVRGGPALCELRVRCLVARSLRLRPLPTVSLHGAFERALRREACSERDRPHCEGCPREHACAYPALMQPRCSLNGVLERSGAAQAPPKPYVLAPGSELLPSRAAGFMLEAGERLSFSLLLVGRAVEHAAVAGRALRRAMGLLGPRLAAGERWCPALRVEALERVEPVADVLTSPSPRGVVLSFLTPFRIKDGGRLTGSLGPETFAKALSRRITLLAACHRAEALHPPAVHLASNGLELECLESRLLVIRRRSSRQGRQMVWPGVVGRWRMAGPALPSWWPWLRLGARLHVGKATTFGFGRYTLRPG